MEGYVIYDLLFSIVDFFVALLFFCGGLKKQSQLSCTAYRVLRKESQGLRIAWES